VLLSLLGLIFYKGYIMTIKQSNGLIRVSDTTITIETCTIYTSRLISNHLYQLNVDVDGTIEDLLAKCDRVSKLSNELYIEFDKIKKGVESS